MRLVPNWRAVLRHAWSIRFILAALALDVLAAVLPLLDAPPVLAVTLAGLGAAASTGAFFSRLVAQQQLTAAPEPAWEDGEEL